jgi:short-subunit dehydrogenase
MTDFDRGTVVIVGASSGIGQACAVHLDRLGFQVFAGVLTETEATDLQQKTSSRLIPLILDITNEKQIASAAQTVANAVGKRGIIGLINNAGIASIGPLEISPLEGIKKQLDVNVVGIIAVTQAFIPLLRQSRGRLLNIGSICGFMPSPFYGVYPASKYALESISDLFRFELRPWGIDVSLIQLGPVESPLFEKIGKQVEDLETSLSPGKQNLYSDFFEMMHRWRDNNFQDGLPKLSTEAAVSKIIYALTTSRPKSRYFVAKISVKVWSMIRFLPDWILDAILREQMYKAGIEKTKINLETVEENKQDLAKVH